MTQTLEAPAQELAKQGSNGNGATVPATVSRAIAPPIVTDDGQFANILDASKFSHLQRVAQLFASSGLVPVHFQGNTANCFIALQMAMRMGVDPFMFMQNTYIVYGRPGMEAKLAIALINSSGLFTDSLDYEIEGGPDPKSPNYRVRAFAIRKTTGKRVDGPWIDWGMVKAEEWHSKKGSKWPTIPGVMFQYRAAMFFGRLHCPERLMGMQTVDELRDTGELAPIESGQSVNRAEALYNKITNRPVSEGQQFVPNPDVLAQAESESTQPLESPAEQLKAHDFSVTTPVGVDPATGEATDDQEHKGAAEAQRIRIAELCEQEWTQFLDGWYGMVKEQASREVFDKCVSMIRKSSPGAVEESTKARDKRMQWVEASLSNRIKWDKGLILPSKQEQA